MSSTEPTRLDSPEIARFWDGLDGGVLLLPRCRACSYVIWYPRVFCPMCLSTDAEWIPASGRGHIYSFTVDRRQPANVDPQGAEGPSVLAYVELREGPRVIAAVRECDPSTVHIGQPVEVLIETTPLGPQVSFRPSSA